MGGEPPETLLAWSLAKPHNLMALCEELQSIAILQQYSMPVQQRVSDLAGLLDELVIEWCATEVAAET